MVDHPAAAAEQATRGGAGGRPAGLERHLLAASKRLTLGRNPRALRPGDDLLQPLHPVAEARHLGQDFRCSLEGLRWRFADGRFFLDPRSSARCERQKGGPQTPEGHGAPARCMGRSRGGLTTKIHALADGNGLPIALKLTEGQAHDGRSAADMLDGLGPGQILLADRGYGSDALRARLNERGAWANVKPMPNRVNIPAFSPFLYRYRNLVERFFNKIKHFRAVATRFEKHGANYLALVKLAAAKVWMRFMSR